MIQQIWDNLSYVYPLLHFDRIGKSCVIHEKDAVAKVKDVKITTKGAAFVIKNSLQLTFDSLYDANKGCMHHLSHNCDGVLAVEISNELYIVFIELKSKYCEGEINKARKQLLCAYLRTIMALNVVEGVDIASLHYCALIVSKPLSEEDLTNFHLYDLQGTASDFCKEAISFAVNEDWMSSINRDAVFDAPVTQIKDTYLPQSIPLFHVNVPEDKTGTTISIDRFLNKL